MCRCQACGKEYKIDVIVSDWIWEIIKPTGKPSKSGLLCGKCILERMEERITDYKAFQLVTIA